MADIISNTINNSDLNVKAIVRDMLDRLPDNCTFEDVMLEIYTRASLIESREQITDGKGISLQETKKEFDSWFKSQFPQSSSAN